MPSSTSWELNVAPGGGTGMNGALHAHRIVNAPSRVASFRSRRRNAFMIGIASVKVQEQGARRRAGRGKSRSSGLAASTLLADGATGFAPRDLDAEVVPLQLLLQAEAGEAQDLGGLRLVVRGAAQGLAQQRALETFDARLEQQAVW